MNWLLVCLLPSTGVDSANPFENCMIDIASLWALCLRLVETRLGSCFPYKNLTEHFLFCWSLSRFDEYDLYVKLIP